MWFSIRILVCYFFVHPYSEALTFRKKRKAIIVGLFCAHVSTYQAVVIPTLALLPASLLGGVDRDQVSIPPCSSGSLRLRDQQWHVHAHSYLCRSDGKYATGRSFSRKQLLFTFGLMLGMESAVETLCGQAHGAHRCDMLGVYLQRSTVVLLLTGLPVTLLFIFSTPLLTLLGEPADVASTASIFVYGMIPMIFADACNFPIKKFIQSQSIVTPSAYIPATTLVLHLLLSWLAVFKLEWGLVGLSLIHSLSWWIIGLRSSALLCLEAWYAQILVLLAGLLKNPELALDALAIW
ncbi:hypothetical protein HID58_083545 [Brassica napus]|uniref:Protein DETOXIFICATION n=1 Tax=Brassica napus TaxID=3708 RepID=A0ABQ7YDT1_BRANA|nr:hypothetical protein HID58_083545 [Brassica napus]